MIEKIVLDYLNNVMAVPVYMEMPEEPPEKFVLIEKTGSGLDNYIHAATLAVQSYGASLLEAANLNEEVKEFMLAITSLGEICSCKLNSDYNYTDTQKKKYRYQAVFDLIHY